MMSGYSTLNTSVLLDVMKVMKIDEDAKLELFDRIRGIDEKLTASAFEEKDRKKKSDDIKALAEKQRKEMLKNLGGGRK